MKTIERLRDFSENQVCALRTRLAVELPAQANVVTCGSYARRDASAASDLDYFCINPSADSDDIATKVHAAVMEIVGKAPSKDGAFAQNVTETQLLSNIGGWDDDNQNITRRILYLLEGDFLTDEEAFGRIRRKLIERYVETTPKDHQIAFYLLNDIVRYWRTIAVDYAHKTSVLGPSKPWGVRNLKLVYSRKLIYASGIFSVALTADRSESEKVAVLDMLFSLTPIERMRYVCGDAAILRLLQLYDRFLECMDDEPFRERMDSLKPEEKHTDEDFRKLKNEGHYFSRELMGLLEGTFHRSHPIHMSLIF